MAGAEDVPAHEDRFLKNLRPVPAKVIQLEYGNVKVKQDLRKRGFNKLNVVVIESNC